MKQKSLVEKWEIHTEKNRNLTFHEKETRLNLFLTIKQDLKKLFEEEIKKIDNTPKIFMEEYYHGKKMMIKQFYLKILGK